MPVMPRTFSANVGRVRPDAHNTQSRNHEHPRQKIARLAGDPDVTRVLLYIRPVLGLVGGDSLCQFISELLRIVERGMVQPERHPSGADQIIGGERR